MRDGNIKKFLYITKIIPAYALFQEYRIKRKERTDKWYFKYLPIKKNKIVFDNFAGNGYGDNPRAIAEEIIRQGINCDLVFLVKTKDKIPGKIRQVVYGSPQAMLELATAKMWVFNFRRIKHPKKRKGQIYFHTSHGNYGFKSVEGETTNLSDEYVQAAKLDGSITDYILSSCHDDTEKMSQYYWLNEKTTILELGTPKDDVLFDERKKRIIRKRIRDELGISDNMGVILYMPTFRDDFSIEYYDLNFYNVISAFSRRFAKEFMVLLRLHPNISKRSFELILDTEKVIDVSSYTEATDLLFASDFMISDYSGAIISFALLEKPVFLYTPDLYKFKSSRGLRDYYNKIPCRKAMTNEELVNNVLNYDDRNYFFAWRELFDEINYVNLGESSKKVVEWIKDTLG